MRNLILASLAAVAIQAQSVEDAFADLFTGEPVELTPVETAQAEICNTDETYGSRCSCVDLVIKASGLDPALFAQANEACTDGALPEVDASLYEPIENDVVPEEVQEIIIEEAVEEVQEMQEAVTEEGSSGLICEPEDPDCWAPNKWIQYVTYAIIIGILISYAAYYFWEEPSAFAMSLLQSEVFNLSMQDYYQKVGMNLALEF